MIEKTTRIKENKTTIGLIVASIIGKNLHMTNVFLLQMWHIRHDVGFDFAINIVTLLKFNSSGWKFTKRLTKIRKIFHNFRS